MSRKSKNLEEEAVCSPKDKEAGFFIEKKPQKDFRACTADKQEILMRKEGQT